MRTKRIVVLAGYPFPIGMAATTRIIAYASGLQAHGVSVEVVNFSHVAPDAEVYPDSGTVDGVRYTYFLKCGQAPATAIIGKNLKPS